MPPDGIQSQHSAFARSGCSIPQGGSRGVNLSADTPNRIRQTATGLEVGKAYGLQFVTADVQDVTEKKPYLE